MKKIGLSVLFAFSVLLPSLAVADRLTLSLGYVQSKVQHMGKARGAALKYYYEWDYPVGLMASVSYLSGDENNTLRYGDTIYRPRSKIRSWSALAGPAWRINDFISLYGLIGFTNAKVSADVAWYKQQSNYIYAINGAERATNLAYGAGIQINLIKDLAIDLGYEGSRVKFFGDHYRMNGFNVGIGYRF